MRVRTLFIAALLVACDGRPTVDPAPFDAPALPDLSPCPAGWDTVELDGATHCEPWLEHQTCPVGQAHFPGGVGCEVVGSPCPTGEWPEGLPTDVPILYVRSGATGGDGSLAAPFGQAQSALDAASVPGTIVALGKGTFQGPLEIPGTVVVWGACTAETVITSEYPLVVLAAGQNAALRNVRLTGPVPGIWVQTTSIDVQDVVIDNAAQAGVSVLMGGRASLRNVAIQNTQVDPVAGNLGVGVAVEEGSTAELSRVVIEANRATGLNVRDAGSSVSGSDVAVLDTQPDSDGSLGRGIDVEAGASVVLERLVVSGNRDVGVFAADPGTTLTLRDAVVSSTATEALGYGGRGITLQSGAHLTSERLLVSNNHDGGIVVLGGSLDARQTIVRGTLGRGDLAFGRGIGVGPSSSAQLDGTLVVDNHDVGVLVDGEGAMLVANDLTVLRTQAQSSDLQGGRGVGIQNGARAEISRARIADSREAGVMVNASASVQLRDVEVVATREAECAATSCSDLALGDGILVTYGSQATCERFRVADSERAGVMVGPDSQVDLTSGEIVRNAIGASIQVEGFDVARLSNDVLYLENGRNLDRSALSLPEPSAAF